MSARARFVRHAGIVAIVAGAAAIACDSATAPPTRRGPGGIPVLEIGREQTGTVAPGGTNSFLVVGPADTALRIFLRATSGRAADSLIAEVGDFVTRPTVQVSAASIGTDSSIDDQATGSFRLQAGDTMLVTVRARGADDGGPYAILLRAPDPRPEVVSPALVLGDTLADESIDVYGDVDEFTFSGTSGDDVRLFLRATSGNAGDHLRAMLLGPTGQELLSVTSFGTDAELTTQGGFPLALPSSGTYRVRVQGDWGYWDDTKSGRGPYELLVYRVNRAPETGSAATAIGDTVAGSIEAVGDIDEFSFVGQAGEQIELNLQLLEGFTQVVRYDWVVGGLFAELSSGSTRLALIGSSAPAADLDRLGTGGITLPATQTYTVRLRSHFVGTLAGATGRYRFELYRVNPAPERAGGSIAVSDTVFDERLERPADIDEFTFVATADARLAIFLSAPEAAAGGTPLTIELVDPSGQQFASGQSVHGYDGTTYVGGGGVRFTVPASGTYTARVSGRGWRQAAYPTPYALEVYAVNLAPESVPADVSPGDVMAGERIDRIADVDRFRLHGTTGDEINIFVRSSDPNMGVVLLFEEWFPVTSWDGVSGRRELTRTGEHSIELWGMDALTPTAGAYEFEIYRIVRAPETLSATYVVGDTITAERIDRVGDIDEYTFTAAAGEQLRFVCEAREGGVPRGIVCLVANHETGEPITGVLANRSEEQQGWGDFTVPESGTYRVRIMGGNDGQSMTEYGEYRFGLERLP